jgi:hypothetical protein
MSPERFDEIAAAAQRKRQANTETVPGLAAILGNAGVPLAAARVLAETILTLRARIDQLERLSASNLALNDLSGRVAVCEGQISSLDTAPAHMRGREKRG